MAHVNAIFPDILFLGPFFAPVILRVGVALFFLISAREHWLLGTKKNKLLGAKKAVLALFFLAGFLTQLVALVGILVVLLESAWLKTESKKGGWEARVVVVASLLALVIAGAGALAVDKPF